MSLADIVRLFTHETVNTEFSQFIGSTFADDIDI